MNKEALMQLLVNDMDGGYDVHALANELEKLRDDQVDDFIIRHFDELKEFPSTGKNIRSYKPGKAADENLASDFGYSSVDELFGLNSKKHWTRYKKQTLEDIAKDNGMTYDQLRQGLIEAQKNYNDANLVKERKRIAHETMNPKFLEHPIDFIALSAMKSFFPSTMSAVEEDIANGEGDAAGGGSPISLLDVGRFGKSMLQNHTKDFIVDAFLSGASFVPVGRLVSNAAPKIGSLGRIAVEGSHQAANTAASEGYQAIEHDKEFDPFAVGGAAVLGGSFEVTGKQIADMIKSGFKGSKTAKKVAEKIEDVFSDKKQRAQDYINEKSEVIRQYEEGINNPGSRNFKRTKENYKNEPVTKGMYDDALEAQELFSAVKENRRPRVRDELDDIMLDTHEKVPRYRDMTDNEAQEAFLRHPAINDFSGANLGSGKKSKFSKFVEKSTKKIPEAIAVGVKLYRYNKESENDVESRKLAALKRKEAQWVEGDIPRSASDPDWSAYQDWASKHPKEAEQSKIASLYYGY